MIISHDELNDNFKSMHKIVTVAAISVLLNKLGKDEPFINGVLIPFDKSKIDMHFQDPESGQTGTVNALKVIDIPYQELGNFRTLNNEHFISSVNKIYLNPLMRAISEAFDKEDNKQFRLYAKYDSEKSGSFVLYIIFNGDVGKESATVYESDLEGVFLDDDEDANLYDPVVFDDAISSDIKDTTNGKVSNVTQDGVPGNPEQFLAGEDALNGLISVKFPIQGYKHVNDFIYALSKSDIVRKRLDDIINDFKEHGMEPFSGTKDYFDKKWSNYNFISGSQEPHQQMISANNTPSAYEKLFTMNGALLYAKSIDLIANKSGGSRPSRRFIVIMPFRNGIKEELLHIEIVHPGLFIGISLETGETFTEDMVALEGAFLRISVPDGIETPDDMVNLLKKAGIEETIQIKTTEIIKKGYKPIRLSEYNNKKHTGVNFDKEFRNDMYISYHYGKPSLKETREFIYKEIGGSTIVIGLYKSVTASPNNKLHNRLILNRGPANANKGYRLKKVWMAVYNEHTDRVLHKPIATPSKLFGVRVEATDVAMEGFFTPFHGNDWGLSCRYDKILPNKHTYHITSRTGQIYLSYPLNPDVNDLHPLVSPFVALNIEKNIEKIWFEFQRISSDWDLFDIPRMSRDVNLYRKELEGLFENNNFDSFIIHDAVRDNNNRSYDLHHTFKPMWYVHQVLAIVNYRTFRRSDAEKSDFWPVNVADIYMVCYNTATHKFAVPILASDGNLMQTHVKFSNKASVASVISGFSRDFHVNKKVINASDFIQTGKAADMLDTKEFRSMAPSVKLSPKQQMDIRTLLEKNKDVTKPMSISVLSESYKMDLNAVAKKLRSVLSHENIAVTIEKSFYPTEDNIVILGETQVPYHTSVKSIYSASYEDGTYPSELIDRIQAQCDIITEESGSLKNIKVIGGKGIKIIGQLVK
jgi:hypothetical protein